jgi:hypothetical protein
MWTRNILYVPDFLTDFIIFWIYGIIDVFSGPGAGHYFRFAQNIQCQANFSLWNPGADHYVRHGNGLMRFDYVDYLLSLAMIYRPAKLLHLVNCHGIGFVLAPVQPYYPTFYQQWPHAPERFLVSH